MPIGQLKAQCNRPGRTVKTAGCGLVERHRHQRAVVGAAHPTLDDVRHSEGFQHFAYSRELTLAAHHTDRIVLADIASGLTGRDCLRGSIFTKSA